MNNVTYLPLTTSLFLQRLGGILLLMLVSQLAVAAVPNGCDSKTIEDYVAAFNKIDRQENVQIAKSFEIFERVSQVADNPGIGLFKLTVTGGKVARAMALPENNVLLSKPAVEVIHGKASPPEIEARLAFVLGHELAHLAHEDLSPHTLPKLTDNCGDHRPNYLEQESTADVTGFMYAGMAGYRVDLLLQSSPDDFLTYWVKMVSPQKLDSPELKTRVANLKVKLQQVLDRLPFFYFGTRLAHFERCADGKEFLKQFQQAFPAREVWNNLGFCYLQEARRSMKDPLHSEFYWMPLTLDTESRAGSFTRGEEISNRLGNMPNSSDTEGYLREAEFQFKKAVDSDKNYWPAKVNLAIVDLYLNTPNIARESLKQAEPLVPFSFQAELQALQAVAVYEQSDVVADLWPNAVKLLQELIPPKSTTAPLSALYNLARLYEVRQRPAEAKTNWDLLAGRMQELPEPIAKIVCERQKISSAKECPTTAANVTDSANTKDYPTFIQWPIPFAWNPLSGQASVQATLNGLKWIPVNLSSQASLRGKIYYTANQDEVLELDDYLQMQVVKGEWVLDAFRNECARPLRPRQVPSGTLWSCGKWAALEKGGKVREVWGVLRLE
jgi:tetratricopeptide (TPR) repeat protein